MSEAAARTGGFGVARGCRGEKPGFKVRAEAVWCILSTVREPKRESRQNMNHARHRYSRISALARLRRAGILLAVIALSGMFVIRADGWRSVHGIVRDRSGRPLGRSVVQIENMLTLNVRSYIVKNDGNYHFMRLSPDIEYTLKARYRNVWGAKKTLSVFDSRKNAEVMLTVDVEKEE
jgi:hypothetical protein